MTDYICTACTDGNHSGCEGDVRLVAFMQNRIEPAIYCGCYGWNAAHLQGGKQNGSFTPEELFDHQHALGISEWETRYDERDDYWERLDKETTVPYEIG